MQSKSQWLLILLLVYSLGVSVYAWRQFRADGGVDHIFRKYPAAKIGSENLFTGDSMVALCPWEEILPNKNILNFGFNGYVVGRLTPLIDRLPQSRYKSVHLMIGINDINARRKTSEIIQDYNNLLQKLVANQGSAEIFVYSVLPILKQDYLRIDNQKVFELNSQLKPLIESNGLNFIDITSHFLDKNSNSLRKDMTNDGIHLNEKGCDAWKENILKAKAI